LISSIKKAAISAAVLFFAGCASTVLVPPERAAIFPAEKVRGLIDASEHEVSGVTGFWTPSEKDVEGAENRLSDYLFKIRMAHPIEIDRRMPEWQYFHRQAGGIVKDGRKMIFIAYSSTRSCHPNRSPDISLMQSDGESCMTPTGGSHNPFKQSSWMEVSIISA
jgi:hypothetical protein